MDGFYQAACCLATYILSQVATSNKSGRKAAFYYTGERYYNYVHVLRNAIDSSAYAEGAEQHNMTLRFYKLAQVQMG